MDVNLVKEIEKKLILHWNYRNLREFPHELQKGHHIVEIYLKNNDIERLPLWLGQLNHLTNLYLSGNQLKSLPNEIEKLESLICLDVGENHLNDLPSTICKLPHLSVLCASRNYLRCIPEEIWDMKSLKVLLLSGNMLTYLPESISKCSNLEELCLDENYLTCLPRQIAHLPNLDHLSVAGNKILYLPATPFVSSARICFERNPFLNYLTYCLGSQQSICNEDNGIMWNLETFGCFESNARNTEDLSNFILHIWTPLYQERNCVQLVMPNGLQTVCNGTSGYKGVPSMYELSIRIVYKILFIRQTLNISNAHPLITMTHNPKKQNLLKESFLPQNIEKYLQKGPTTICSNPICNIPIFSFAFVWIISKYVMNSAGDIREILSALFFCSDYCSIHCTAYNEFKQSRIDW